MRFPRLALACAALPLVIACAATAEGPAGTPFTYDDAGRPTVLARINGAGPYPLAVDSAAGRTAVSQRVLDALAIAPDPHQKAQVHGVSGVMIVDLYPIDSLEFGDVRAENLVTLAPQASLHGGGDNPGASEGHDGIVGADVFGGKRLAFDFDAMTVDVGESGTTHGGAVLSATFAHGSLALVDVTVNGVAARALIDTGAKASLGNPALADRLGAAPADDGEDITATNGAGVTGDAVELIGTADAAIDIGALALEVPAMTFADAHIFRQLELDGEPALILGMDALPQLGKLAIDHGTGTVEIGG